MIADCKRSTGSHGLIVGMHCSIVLDAFWRTSRARPIFWMILSIRPNRSVLSIVGQCSLRPVMSEFDGKFPTSGEFENLAVHRRCCIASTFMLEPPFLLGEIVKGPHSCVGIEVDGRKIRAPRAIHAFGPGDCVCLGSSNQC